MNALLLLLVLFVSFAVAQNPTDLCAVPAAGCTSLTMGKCTTWDGCFWRFQSPQTGKASCQTRTLCLTTSSPVPQGETIAPSPPVPTVAPTSCIDVPQVAGGCSSATSLTGCEQFWCCTWMDKTGQCVFTPADATSAPVGPPKCAGMDRLTCRAAAPYCIFQNNACKIKK